eukprot:4742592-Pyramimonas_sp.AAC.1
MALPHRRIPVKTLLDIEMLRKKDPPVGIALALIWQWFGTALALRWHCAWHGVASALAVRKHCAGES